MADSFFATLDQKIHRTVRSRVSGTYSMTAVLGMESLISDVMTSNIRKLRDVSRRGPVSIDKWVNYFTFDVVGQLSMGGPIGFLDQEQDVNGIIRSIHDGFYLMANFGHIPLQTFWFNNSFSRYLIRNFGGRRLNSFETFVGWLDKRVTERMKEEPGAAHNDMLQYFINGRMPNGEPVGKGEVMIEGINILGAGADTTAIAILAVLGAIMTHEGAYEKLQEDVDAAYGNAGLQTDADGELSFHDAERIPYLSAVVRESMRLHPSITYQLPRVPPPEGLKIGDFYIPSSATCGISPAAMNRDTTIFGPDAARWVPERWIPSKEGEDEAKRLRVMEQNLTTVSTQSEEPYSSLH
jgi:cytochrome P450